jgi:hypothetical protein
VVVTSVHVIGINAGGPAVGLYVADVDFTGGSSFARNHHAILLGAVTDPAPMAKDKYAMRSRREKIEAKRAAGLGVKLNPDCGNPAVPG